ncbi:hypothetical protein AWB67_06611 [Caballeronia terrestris]|uniref:Glycosyltransferase RgtA/B/C/D-like domain-containing protein n=1 Tax=Caballeronia terrestris TaxID=1226301 RepID=A0A158KUQ8_9BURK|nr:hypothetical protein [Caballeronia terrestris]SAL84171.1 hypothetical protein AWB67_06611 [Caballeronia terrestris]
MAIISGHRLRLSLARRPHEFINYQDTLYVAVTEKRKLASALMAFSLVVFYISIRLRLGTELPDDAAFFLRYAENMGHGQFWAWNLNEAPVWGASAPLFPLLLVLPIKLGVPPVDAIVWVSIIFSTLSLTAVSLMLARHFGYLAGVAFTVLAALDTGAMFYAGSGLETPLTFALLAFGLYALLEKKGDVAIGIAAGLLAVQTMDLVPAAGLLVLALAFRRKQIPVRAVVIAAAITVAWYSFAWIYFGAPVPNSFLTKAIYQDRFAKTIDWHWFGGVVLFRYGHWIYVLLSLLGIAHCWPRLKPFLIYSVGLIAAHVGVYTFKYPFEPYDWYCMPAIFMLLVLGSVGLASLGRWMGKLSAKQKWMPAGVVVMLLAAIVADQLAFQQLDARVRKNWLGYVEHDRADAGRWVNEHTPKSFRVATYFDSPVYYSERYVYDLSFLNRHVESGNVLERYRPEILVFQNMETATPMTPDEFAPDYKVVKVFDSGFGAGQGNIFFTVYARSDVISQLSDVTFPVRTSCKSLNDCQRYQPVVARPVTSVMPPELALPQIVAEQCSIDAIGGASASGQPTVSKSAPVDIDGWAFPNSKREPAEDTFLRLTGTGGTFYALMRGGKPRGPSHTDSIYPRL